MNEWIDFLAFAIQATVLWVAMPRWCARFTRPMLIDRNPDWAAANPETMAQLEQGGWWVKAIQGWGVISVLLLLACRLGLQPPILSPQSLRRPLSEVLLTTSNLLMLAGFLLFGYGMLSFFRWQKHNVPLAGSGEDMLASRHTDDFVPRWAQYLVYSLMAANILARPVASLFRPDRIHNVWGSFATGIALSAVLFLVAMGSVMRAPNHMDRVVGPVYRRMEVRVCFGLMLCVVAMGLATLYVELSGLDPKRYGAVFVSLLVTATVTACMRLPTAPPKNKGPAEDQPAPLHTSGPRVR